MAEEREGGELPLEELARRITSGAVRLAAATAAWLVLVAEFDRRGGWGAVGIRSCAHWLASPTPVHGWMSPVSILQKPKAPLTSRWR